MKQITQNVFVESGFTGCNLGLVTTKEGNVIIDTPMLPPDAVKWRDEVAKKGEVRYIINTEEHGDHCQNNWFFSGVLITSQVTREKLAKQTLEDAIERIKRLAPHALPFPKGFQMRLADITFTEKLDFYLGGLTFKLFSLPGHSTGGIGVFIPEERVAFATDCVFHHYKSWLVEAMPDKWLESLKKLSELDIDIIVPGHGSPCNKGYLEEQADIIRKWVQVVKSAIEQGLSEDEAADRISVPDPYAKQPNTPFTESEVNRKAIARLYRLYSK